MEKDVYVKIGERLRKQRRIMGLTQEQAAELLGVSTTYYGEIERGNRKLTIPRILTVYEKMNLEPTYLLTGEILTDKVYDEIFDGWPWRRYLEVFHACTEDRLFRDKGGP